MAGQRVVKELSTPFGTFTDVHVEVGKYDMAQGGDGIAVTLWSLEEGPLAIVSVNIPGKVPPAGWFYAKAYSENEGLPEALRDAGVLELGEAFEIGPFGSKVYAARLTEEYR